jgi:hypothetical protein
MMSQAADTAEVAQNNGSACRHCFHGRFLAKIEWPSIFSIADF